MRYRKQILLTLLVFLGLVASSHGQASGLHMLSIGAGTQSLSLNEAVTVELLGGSNLYSNPANLALEENSSLNADYTLWIGDIKHTHAAVNFKKGNRGLALGFIGSKTDDIPLRGNQAGPSQGTFNTSFLSLAAGYAYRFGQLALGGTVQYLREEYYIYNASGYGINLGTALTMLDKRLRFGASLLNLGEMSDLRNTSTRLPTTARAGFRAELFTFSPPQNTDLPITVNLLNDWVFPLKAVSYSTQGESNKNAYSNISLEFDIADIIQLRSGYKTGNNERHWSFGAGILFNSITANYAMVPFSTGFGTVHSLGLQYHF